MIVNVKPFEPKKVFGHLSHTGKLTKNGKIVPHWPEFIGASKFIVDGHGVVLNLEREEDKLFYEIITESDQLRSRFSMGKDTKRKAGARFYIEDVEADSKAYLAEREQKAVVDAFIANLDEKQTLRFGLPLGLSGSYSKVRASLYKLAENPDGRKKLADFINNKARVVIETIYEAMKYGDAANKKGVYKDGREMIYMNGQPIGLGINQAVNFFQQPENVDMYKALKDMVLIARGDKNEDVMPAKSVQKAKKELPSSSNNIEIPE
jgi:hypothetical protein